MIRSRQINYEQLVREADPDYDYESNTPVIYRFSSGRKFRRPLVTYAAGDFVLDTDQGILDVNTLA